MPPPRPEEGNNQKAENHTAQDQCGGRGGQTRDLHKAESTWRCLWRSNDQSLGPHVVPLLWLLFTAVEPLQLLVNSGALGVQKTGWSLGFFFALRGFPPVPWGPTGVPIYPSKRPLNGSTRKITGVASVSGTCLKREVNLNTFWSHFQALQAPYSLQSRVQNLSSPGLHSFVSTSSTSSVVPPQDNAIA